MAQELSRNPNIQNVTRQQTPSWMDKYKGADYGSAGVMGVQDLITGLVNLAKNSVAVPSATLRAISGTPVGQNPMDNISKAVGQSLSPYQEGVKKALKQSGEAHAAEAIQMGVPPSHIEQQSGLTPLSVPTNLNSVLANPQPGSPGISNGLPQMNPAKSVFSGASIDQQTGDVTQQGIGLDILHNILPAFFPGSTGKTIKQQNDLYTMTGNKQKITGTEPIQPKDFLDNNVKMLVASLSKDGKLSDAQKSLDAYNTFGEKMAATMDSYQNLKDAGKTGPISGNLAKLASTFSKGDPDLAEFDSLMTGLTFAGANFLAQQSGRSMSDADFKNVQKMITLKNTSKDSTVRGKMQSVISQLNASVPAGGKKLPDVGTLINEIKKARQGQNQKTQSSQGKQTVGRFQVEYHG